MKEHPILFSGPMVRAILEGRKTQTRRVVGPSLRSESDGSKRRVISLPRDLETLNSYLLSRQAHPLLRFCKFGQPGDRLWVKETHRFDGLDPKIALRFRLLDHMSYRADMEGDRACDDCAWRPSIFMPRWASRITLEITRVRVERLQDITKADAVAEGIERIRVNGHDYWKNYRFKTAHPKQGVAVTDKEHRLLGYESPCASFQSLWEFINGPGSWDANPWVWVVSFSRVKAPQ